MSIVGTVGKASVVHDDVIANTDRNVATIKLSALINPHYLSIFLNCKYGTNQTGRFSTGNVQPLLNLSQIKQLKICNFSISFQSEIEKLSHAQDAKLKQSKLCSSRNSATRYARFGGFFTQYGKGQYQVIQRFIRRHRPLGCGVLPAKV